MDGREAMTMSGGSAQFYIHRGGVGGSVSAAQAGGFHSPPGFRVLSNPNAGQPQSNVRGGSVGPAFSMEAPHSHTNTHFVQDMNMSMEMEMDMSPEVPQTEPVKKKRGRPRKYAPDGSGSMSLRLSPMSAPNPCATLSSPNPKRSRGRPPGTGRKQQLAVLGEWMNESAGIAFAPYVVHAVPGEDIAAKILSFAQQRPRAVCILSGSGAISLVTLRQPTSGGSITYEGRFEILCLSGSYLVAEDGGPQSRTGGVSVSLSSPEGHVVGGSVGALIAASPVQVVLCTFVHGGARNKNKQIISSPKGDENTEHKEIIPTNVPPATQSFTPSPMNAWSDSRNPQHNIIHGGARNKNKQRISSPKGDENTEHKAIMPTNVPSATQSFTPSPMNAWPDLRNPQHNDIDLTR